MKIKYLIIGFCLISFTINLYAQEQVEFSRKIAFWYHIVPVLLAAGILGLIAKYIAYRFQQRNEKFKLMYKVYEDVNNYLSSYDCYIRSSLIVIKLEIEEINTPEFSYNLVEKLTDIEPKLFAGLRNLKGLYLDSVLCTHLFRHIILEWFGIDFSLPPGPRILLEACIPEKNAAFSDCTPAR